MRIGIDFDNTIVCYDDVFYREAVARHLIPPQTAPKKSAVRNFLRQTDREDQWTQLQGHVYGPAIRGAAPFPGLREFLSTMHRRGAQMCIISHKTRHPVVGPNYDLHAAARGWLDQQQLLDKDRFGLSPDGVYFEETKDAKIERIQVAGCTHFIDDLPELLAEPTFPEGVVKILFDPHHHGDPTTGVRCVCSWQDMARAME